jgi:hypothetical protein
MKILMVGVRILLILMVAVVFDLGSPVLPEAGEDGETYEGATHGQRRLHHLVREAAPASTPVRVAVVVVPPARRELRRPAVRATVSPIRKPPPLPDPSSASDDH